MMDMGCVAYDVVYVIKSVWMSEHALHFVIRRGVWGLQGASPYGFGLLGAFFFFFFFYLSGQSRTVIGVRDHFHLGGHNNFCPNFSSLPEKSNMFGQCIFASHGGGGGGG